MANVARILDVTLATRPRMVIGMAILAAAFLPPTLATGSATALVLAAAVLSLGTLVVFPFEMDTIIRLSGNHLVATHYGFYNTIVGVGIMLGNLFTGTVFDLARDAGMPQLPWAGLVRPRQLRLRAHEPPGCAQPPGPRRRHPAGEDTRHSARAGRHAARRIVRRPTGRPAHDGQGRQAGFPCRPATATTPTGCTGSPNGCWRPGGDHGGQEVALGPTQRNRVGLIVDGGWRSPLACS